ncbi:uncharacterized protein LOC123539786 [Mercenaria mercenaria]|uniref:uncharacterized protein LOC123539786 n=1 Tax=Mercenaria mercenaria TaxID=6596 RepID=UPI00234EF7F6|nr:uncharacterized protein LOC123539786 [Mercenaria mercenaria]
MAETVENRTLVCDCLEELFKCINRTVPNCVDTMKDKYLAFSFTPWDCHLLEHYTTGDDKCGNDVIFEVRFKKEADETDIIHPDDDYDIQGSSDSCKIDAVISTPYITFIVLFLILWFHP